MKITYKLYRIIVPARSALVLGAGESLGLTLL